MMFEDALRSMKFNIYARCSCKTSNCTHMNIDVYKCMNIDILDEDSKEETFLY